MKKRHYPLSLFVLGFITNVIFHFFWLFVPAVILLLLGIFFKPCLYIGLALLIIDLIVSLIEQFMLRNTLLKDSDNEYFREFQNVFEKDGSWWKNVTEYVDEKAVRVDYSSENAEGEDSKEDE